MRRLFSLLFPVLFPLLAFGQSAGLTYNIGSAELSGRGDSLYVKVHVSFNGFLAEDDAYVVKTVLEGMSNVAYVRPYGVYGRKAYVSRQFASTNPSEERVFYGQSPLELDIEDMLVYDQWMDDVKVCVSVYRWSVGDSQALLHSSRVPWSFSKSPAPEMPATEWRTLYPPQADVVSRTVSFSCPVVFADGSTKYEASQVDNKVAMDVFASKLECFLGLKNVKVNSSSLSVYLAPVGDLSGIDKRTLGCVQSFYTALQKRIPFKNGGPKRISGGVDWDGIRSFFVKSEFSQDTRISEILSWDSSDELKVSSLSREKPAAWEDLSLHCFPFLGKVVYTVSYDMKPFSTHGVLREVCDCIPEVMTAYDYCYLSELFEPFSEEWTLTMCLGADSYPECREINMNASMGCILSGNARAAVPYLRNMGESLDAKYVYACWLFAMEREDEAYDYFESLASSQSSYSNVSSLFGPYFLWLFNEVDWVRKEL